MEVLENKKQGERQGRLKGRRKDGRMEGGTKEECEDFLTSEMLIYQLFTLFLFPFLILSSFLLPLSPPPSHPPGNLPNPETERTSLTSRAPAGRFFTTSTTWEAQDGTEV